MTWAAIAGVFVLLVFMLAMGAADHFARAERDRERIKLTND